MTSQALRAMQRRTDSANTAEWQRRHAESKGSAPAVVEGTKHGNPHHGSEFDRVLHGTVPSTPSGRHKVDDTVPNRANDSTRAPSGTYGAQHPLSYQTAPLPEHQAPERNHTSSALRNGGYQHTGFEAGAL